MLQLRSFFHSVDLVFYRKFATQVFNIWVGVSHGCIIRTICLYATGYREKLILFFFPGSFCPSFFGTLDTQYVFSGILFKSPDNHAMLTVCTIHFFFHNIYVLFFFPHTVSILKPHLLFFWKQLPHVYSLRPEIHGQRPPRCLWMSPFRSKSGYQCAGPPGLPPERPFRH